MTSVGKQKTKTKEDHCEDGLNSSMFVLKRNINYTIYRTLSHRIEEKPFRDFICSRKISANIFFLHAEKQTITNSEEPMIVLQTSKAPKVRQT